MTRRYGRLGATGQGRLDRQTDFVTSPGVETLRHLTKPKDPVKQDSKAEDTFYEQIVQYRLHGFTAKKFPLAKLIQEPRKDGRDVERRWIFDAGTELYRIVVEIDGGIWMMHQGHSGGAHSHPADIERNMRKRNDAVFHGYAVLAFTPQQVLNETAIRDYQRLLYQNGWRPNP